MLSIIKLIAWGVSFVLTIYASYFTVISLFSLLPKRQRKKFQPKNKFAVVIAARNEELVIGHLIDSLKNQKYPKELFDIIVIPNNCTDNTRGVAEAKGTKIFDCKRVIRSKGDALEEFFDELLAHNDIYDAFCVFDADNVVDENFLAEMNNALCEGVKIGQGYRDSKNPFDTMISSCYSIYYYMVNRFHNHARSTANMSGMINGSGFMVSRELMKQHGGWHTKTMTEDIEFTTKCVLIGEKVRWIPEAIIYDEQPLTFEQSWKQRKRWSTGLIQGFELYAAQIARRAATHKSMSAFDLLLFFSAPIMQILYFMSIVFTIIMSILHVAYDYFPQTHIFHQMFLSIVYSYSVSFGVALAVVVMEKKDVARMWKGIIGFWFFIATWLPINILCIVKKQTEWTQIKHTRVVKISELVSEKR